MASQYDLASSVAGRPGSVSAAGTRSLGAKVASPGWRDSFREHMFKAGISGEQNKAAEKESPG